MPTPCEIDELFKIEVEKVNKIIEDNDFVNDPKTDLLTTNPQCWEKIHGVGSATAENFRTLHYAHQYVNRNGEQFTCTDETLAYYLQQFYVEGVCRDERELTLRDVAQVLENLADHGNITASGDSGHYGLIEEIENLYKKLNRQKG